MKNEIFKDVEVGDSLWSFIGGWGTVSDIGKSWFELDYGDEYKDNFYFNGSFTMNGNQLVFYDEIKFEVPKKPLPKLEVDTKVLVWDDKSSEKAKRHFKKFSENGTIFTFRGGCSSWSDDGVSSKWEHWELAEDISENKEIHQGADEHKEVVEKLTDTMFGKEKNEEGVRIGFKQALGGNRHTLINKKEIDSDLSKKYVRINNTFAERIEENIWKVLFSNYLEAGRVVDVRQLNFNQWEYLERDPRTTPEYFPDKALVWCWDDRCANLRMLRFWDKKNSCCFEKFSKKRGGFRYDYYKLYQGSEMQEWGEEQRKLLED